MDTTRNTPKPVHLTTKEVAAKLGLSPARVRQLAAERGLRPAVDHPRFKLWHPGVVRLLSKRRPVGRPRGT